MNSPNLLDRSELLELAALDVCGMLDEYESALFTRSFHHAPAAVQREIIDLQAELASDTTLLPEESPDPALRRRVLDAVSRAIEKEQTELAPLATIGHTGAALPSGRVITSNRNESSAPLWRAAAFTLAASLLVVTFFWISTNRDAHRIAMIAIDNEMQDQFEQEFGPTFGKLVLEDDTQRVALRAPNNGLERGTLLINGEGDLGYLAFDGVARGEYVLTMTPDEGAERTFAIASNGSLDGERFEIGGDLSAATLAAATWTLSTLDGAVLLTNG